MKKYDKVKLKGDVLDDLNLTSNDELIIVDFYDEITTNNNVMSPTKYAKVVDKDLNVHSVGLHEIITSKVGKVIGILKDIEVSGEDMQHIIECVGMSEQMLKQLCNSVGLSDLSTVYVGKDSFRRRFDLIMDEVNHLLSTIKKTHQDEWKSKIESHMSNIEIACDLNDDESLDWRFYDSVT